MASHSHTPDILNGFSVLNQPFAKSWIRLTASSASLKRSLLERNLLGCQRLQVELESLQTISGIFRKPVNRFRKW